jgi:Bax protein
MIIVCFEIYRINFNCGLFDLNISNSINRAQKPFFLGAIEVRGHIFLVFLLVVMAALPACQNSPENASGNSISSFPKAATIAITLTSHQELAELFRSYEYGWENLEKGIPPLELKSFPPNLDQIRDLTQKKQAFFLAVLPIALLANQEIQLQREKILQLFEKKDRGESLSSDETIFFESALKYYKFSGDPSDNPKARRELLKRVDIIPPALILAQAASESAYGTSRFSILGNNLFGEWTFTPGTGIVPLERPAGETYEVRRFKSISASVNSYLKNLNTHRAYKELREKRAYLRSEGLPLKSLDLAEGLTRYSIRGKDYVKSIKRIIRQNRLSRLSQAKLRTPTSGPVALGDHNPEP